MAKPYRLTGPDGSTYLSDAPGALGGNSRLRIYGRLHCRSALAALSGGYAARRVFFANEAAAIAAGYRPCGVCLRDRYRAWKAGGLPGTPTFPWLRPPPAPPPRPPEPTPPNDIAGRVAMHAADWGVAVEDTMETSSSVVAFGRRGGTPVVLKVVRAPGDEWRSGEVLAAFGGRGTVRVLDYAGGAVLLERLTPGTALAGLALDGRDAEATEILAGVIGRMVRRRVLPGAFPTVEDWGDAFGRYLAGGRREIPADLVEHGTGVYAALCGSQRERRLLHGDLQHYNVLLDAERGWVAIDPKGVVGEVEYEVGASLRNPWERPALFATAEAVERRLAVYEAALRIDAGRARAWAFAQAVLSAVWSVEDGAAVDADAPALQLALAIRPLVG